MERVSPGGEQECENHVYLTITEITKKVAYGRSSHTLPFPVFKRKQAGGRLNDSAVRSHLCTLLTAKTAMSFVAVPMEDLDTVTEAIAFIDSFDTGLGVSTRHRSRNGDSHGFQMNLESSDSSENSPASSNNATTSRGKREKNESPRILDTGAARKESRGPSFASPSVWAGKAPEATGDVKVCPTRRGNEFVDTRGPTHPFKMAQGSENRT